MTGERREVIGHENPLVRGCRVRQLARLAMGLAIAVMASAPPGFPMFRNDTAVFAPP